MELNKKYGVWGDSDNISRIDDIAYNLYVNYMISTFGYNTGFGSQRTLMLVKNSKKNTYYKKANILLRKEKLERLNEYR